MRHRFSPKVSVAVLVSALLPVIALGQISQSSAGTQSDEEVRKFRAFLSDDWKRWMQDYPEWATWVGFPGQNRRWRDESPAGFEARVKHLRESIQSTSKLHRDALPTSEQLNYDLYLKHLRESEESLQYGGAPFAETAIRWIPVTQMGGIQQDAAQTLALMPHETVSDYDDILARLEALPEVWNRQSR